LRLIATSSPSARCKAPIEIECAIEIVRPDADVIDALDRDRLVGGDLL